MTEPAVKSSVAIAKRIRRSPSDLRAEALAAARKLIVEKPDQTLTMRAVADATGVTYPNLSHHFGSAAGLHAAIAEELVAELLAAIQSIDHEAKTADHDFNLLVGQVFDLFQRDGLGRIFGWLVRAGEMAQIQPIRQLLHDFIAQQNREAGLTEDGRFAEIALMVSFAAYAESSIGALLGGSLNISELDRRRVVAHVLMLLRQADPVLMRP